MCGLRLRFNFLRLSVFINVLVERERLISICILSCGVVVARVRWFDGAGRVRFCAEIFFLKSFFLFRPHAQRERDKKGEIDFCILSICVMICGSALWTEHSRVVTNRFELAI